MLKTLKIVRIVGVGVAVLIVSAVVAFYLVADRALKIGVETAGTKALNVGVSVGDADLSVLGGSVGFANLLIKNPPGYQHDKLLSLQDAHIAVGVKSLLKGVVKIKEIRLDGLDMILEQRGISSNNLQDVIKSIPSADEEAAEPSGKKLHIDSLEITNLMVRVKPLPIPGEADTIPLKLAPIKMTNLGSDNKLDLAVLTGKILVAIARGIAEQGLGLLPKEIIGPLASELKRLGALPEALLRAGIGILEGGADLGKDVIEGGADVGKGIGDALKGLLGKKKKEEQ
ncbi:MAG: hypothetical protein ACYTEL_03955 [Planctomycetota bacterium]|jgi:hypothetical protein